MNFLKQTAFFFTVFTFGMMFFAQLGAMPFLFLERSMVPPGSPNHAALLKVGLIFRIVFALVATIATWMMIRRLNANHVGDGHAEHEVEFDPSAEC